MTPLNGHNPAELPEPAPIVAQRFYEAEAAEGDTTWDDLSEGDRDNLVEYVRGVIGQHMLLLAEQGFRILPPGAVLRPKNDQEAGAMREALRLYAEAQKRKGGLVGAVAPKLILPKGGKLQ